MSAARSVAARLTLAAFVTAGVSLPIPGEEVFRLDCAEVALPAVPHGALLCLGWCNHSQAVAGCWSVDATSGDPAPADHPPLADLSGRARLMIRQGAESDMVAAELATALGRATGWTVILRGVPHDARLASTRRRGTWFDLLARPFHLRGKGRIAIEGDSVRRRFVLSLVP